jgi:hypothetical protein
MQWQWRKLYTKWFDSSSRQERLLDILDRRSLVQEIAIARIEWSAAQERLDWAIGKDHVDYSIFALEAAEKRYEMLLRLAKQKHWDNLPIQSEKESG